MHKSVFQNSKIALLFAGMTIIGAVSMVGTPEDEGVLDRTTKMFAAQRNATANNPQSYTDTQSVGDAPSSDSDAGWGSSTSIFGDYTPGAADAPASGSQQNLPTGTIIPGPQPVVPDNEGVPVPNGDGGQPIIIAREPDIQLH
jgi:hypothetical protein